MSGQGHGAGWLCHPRVPTLTTYEQGSGPVSTPRNAPAPPVTSPYPGKAGWGFRLGQGLHSHQLRLPPGTSRRMALCPLARTVGDAGLPILGRLGRGSDTVGVLVPTSRVSLPLVVSPTNRMSLPPITSPSHQSRVPPTNLVTPPPRQWYLPRSWLHQEATVQAVDVIPEAGAADVKVIISDSAYGRFQKLFPG